MKFMLYGDNEGNEPKKENIDKLCECLFQSEAHPLLLILKHMKKFEFEVSAALRLRCLTVSCALRG